MNRPYAQKLNDIDFFMQAKADHFTVVWPSDLDVAPEYLYENSVKMKAGRPKGTTGAYKEVTRSEKIMFRITPEQKDELFQAAERENLTVSNYIVSRLFKNEAKGLANP